MSDNPEALTDYIAMLERSKANFLGDGVGCRLERKTLLGLLRDQSAALAQQAAAQPADEREAFQAWWLAHGIETTERESFQEMCRLAWQARAALEGQG